MIETVVIGSTITWIAMAMQDVTAWQLAWSRAIVAPSE
jgi:hypothetical protein